MHTFLPCPGFADSARMLDARRLGKQRVETIQVLRALTVAGYGWRHHPAAAMWAGPVFHRSHQSALIRKDPGHYRRHCPDVPDDLPCVWPGVGPGQARAGLIGQPPVQGPLCSEHG